MFADAPDMSSDNVALMMADDEFTGRLAVRFDYSTNRIHKMFALERSIPFSINR